MLKAKVRQCKTTNPQGFDRFVGRSQRGCGVALTVEGGRWARARTCAGARGSGAAASRTPRRPPSRKSRSRPRSARNICAETGSSGSHSIIHRHLERYNRQCDWFS